MVEPNGPSRKGSLITSKYLENGNVGQMSAGDQDLNPIEKLCLPPIKDIYNIQEGACRLDPVSHSRRQLTVASDDSE